MKNQIIFATIFLGVQLLGVNRLLSQSSVPETTTVNINLADVIAMDAGSAAADGAVDFNYLNTTDYNSSKSVEVPNSLVVISSKNFDVKVKAEGPNFISGSNVIPVDVLQLKAMPGGSANGTLNEITLSTTDQVLVGNASRGSKQSVDIMYTISGEKAASMLLGKPKGTYTQKITYTATAL